MTNQPASLFRALHSTKLVLPNAWDPFTASLIESAGATAIATTSAGVAWQHGRADGGGMTADKAVKAIEDIVAVVSIPVTADIEDGYGSSPAEIAETVRSVVEAGAVGINLEDSGGADGSLTEVAEQANRVAAARATGDDLFINARTDIYLKQIGDSATRLEATIERANAYVQAGADGIFVPGLQDLTAIRQLADRLSVPLNVMAGPGAPSVDELVAAGAKRISVGPAITLAAGAFIRRAASELLCDGKYDSLADGLPYPEAQELFGR